MTQVFVEILENQNLLKDYYQTLSPMHEGITYLFSKINSDYEIPLAKDSIETFKVRSKDIFTFDNYDTIDEEYVKVNGELNLNIKLPLFHSNLSSITWESYKKTNYLPITNFMCLRDIEGIYETQKEVNALNKRWRTIF